MSYFLFFSLALILVIFLYARFIEPLWIELSTFQQVSSRLPVENLKILHLTDLHIKGRGRLEKQKLQIVQEKILSLPHPLDLILITGDFIEDDHGIQAAYEFLNKIPKPRLGVFGCLGNHDYVNHNFTYGLFGQTHNIFSFAWLPNLRKFLEQIFQNKPLRLAFEQNAVQALKSTLENGGIRMIENQNLSLQDGDAEIFLIGIDDLCEGNPDPGRASAGVPPDAFSIVLAHNPDLMLDAHLHRFDFAFCGHVHGGQIRIPILGPLYTHGSHLPRRKTSGWFEYGQTRTFISRGLGEGTPLRFNCRPEIAYIEIQRVHNPVVGQ